MAEMHDIEDDVSEIDAVAEDIKAQSAASDGPQATPQEDDDLPEKYRGKSKKQLAEELEHANKSMGRYSNELGEVRRLADELIKSQLKPKDVQEQPKEVDFFENPQEAIRRAVESNPRVQQAEQVALQVQRAQAKAIFDQLHPDAGQIIQGQDFAEFIGKSKIRQELFKKAIEFDVEAGHELFSTFKELKAVKQQQTAQAVSETEKQARKQTMQAASVETGGTGESTKKIWNRQFLLNKLAYDKQWVEENRAEIDAAYREKRVK